MICPKCNNYNKDNAKFCRKCGAPLTEEAGGGVPTPKGESFFEKNKVLIICVAIIAIVAAGAGYFIFGMNSDVPLQTQDFTGFIMSVPVGSNFVSDNSLDLGTAGGFVTYKNIGEYSTEAYYLDVSSLSSQLTPSMFSLEKQEGSLKIYKDVQEQGVYLVERQVGDYTFRVMGSDLDTLKEMANSIKVTGTITNQTASQPAPSAPTSTQTTHSSGPLNIISGSFSTGSELSDKTYAHIYVGSNHAGETVVVQIFYSRDGSPLNQGNYVTVTVDSQGYIDVSSADSYTLYPDHATIKLYNSNRQLQDTLDVSLAPTSGTQTF